MVMILFREVTELSAICSVVEKTRDSIPHDSFENRTAIVFCASPFPATANSIEICAQIEEFEKIIIWNASLKT